MELYKTRTTLKIKKFIYTDNSKIACDNLLKINTNVQFVFQYFLS